MGTPRRWPATWRPGATSCGYPTGASNNAWRRCRITKMPPRRPQRTRCLRSTERLVLPAVLYEPVNPLARVGVGEEVRFAFLVLAERQHRHVGIANRPIGNDA